MSETSHNQISEVKKEDKRLLTNELLSQLQSKRGSKVIVYIVSTRQGQR